MPFNYFAFYTELCENNGEVQGVKLLEGSGNQTLCSS